MSETNVQSEWATFLACPLGGAVIGWIAWSLLAAPNCEIGNTGMREECISLAGREFTTASEVAQAGGAIGLLAGGLLLAWMKFVAADERRRARVAAPPPEADETPAVSKEPMTTGEITGVALLCVGVVAGVVWLLWDIIGAVGLIPGLIVATLLGLAAYGQTD